MVPGQTGRLADVDSLIQSLTFGLSLPFTPSQRPQHSTNSSILLLFHSVFLGLIKHILCTNVPKESANTSRPTPVFVLSLS